MTTEVARDEGRIRGLCVSVHTLTACLRSRYRVRQCFVTWDEAPERRGSRGLAQGGRLVVEISRQGQNREHKITSPARARPENRVSECVLLSLVVFLVGTGYLSVWYGDSCR